MRSLLFVPGDAPDKMQKALASGADALVLDLEDSVALSNKPQARKHVTEFLKNRAASALKIIVRVNPLNEGDNLINEDLDAVMQNAPDMIMLPKAEGGRNVQWLGAKLATHEVMQQQEEGKTRIIAIAPETPSSVFTLGSYRDASPRLTALTWGGGEDLSAATGAQSNRNEDGLHAEPYRLVRNLSLFAAASAGISAIDGVYTNFRDLEGARREAQQAAHDGFTGKLAIHPSQVPVFNEVFTPNAAMVEEAHAIVEIFDKNDGKTGVVNFNGRMLDRPHLVRARNILLRAEAGS